MLILEDSRCLRFKSFLLAPWQNSNRTNIFGIHVPTKYIQNNFCQTWRATTIYTDVPYYIIASKHIEVFKSFLFFYSTHVRKAGYYRKA